MNDETKVEVWPLANSAKAQQLEAQFAKLGIDYRNPGFCDHPAFLDAERSNPRILESYAEYVEARAYTAEYLADARRKVTVAAEALRAAVAADGRLGACVDVSGMLGRMLDRLGLWNYIAKACLTVEYPPTTGLPPTYFYGVDYRQFVAPHAIVVAPPFCVVDVTAKYQPGIHDLQTAHIPESVLIDRFEQAPWADDDLAAPEVMQRAKAFGFSPAVFIRKNHASMFEVIAMLPPRQARFPAPDGGTGETRLRYVIVAVGGVIEPLEGVVGYRPCGRTALEIFQQDVVPQLAP